MKHRDPTNHPRETAKLNKRQTENLRYKMLQRVVNIANRVADCAEGKLTMTREELNAAGKIMDKTIPALQSVEQTIVNDTDGMTEVELLGRLKDLVKSDPSIMSHILGSDHILENKSVEVSKAEPEQGANLPPVH